MKNDLMWVEKYRPKKTAEVVGNEEAKMIFLDWLRAKRRRKKAVLLYGPPGVGKTALVGATADELGFTIIEMNASDTRTENMIKEIAGPATSYVALDKFSTETRGNLLFLDEVDGVFGKEDRGGIGAIIKIIEESQIPVVLAANNPDIDKLRPLKKVCELIRFHQVRIPLIIAMLQRVCLMEHIDAEFEALERIAQNSEGDVRSAVNDLQILSEERRVLRLQDTLGLRPRNKDLDMYETLKGIFSAKSSAEAVTILNRSNADYDTLFLSISDNLPLRYKDLAELGIAYDYVSKADVFRGRIANEKWHLLRYFYNLLAEATTVSPQSLRSFELISFPIRISTLFWTKGKRTTFEGICTKIAARCHVSRRIAKQDFVPFLKIILERQRSSPIGSWLKLDNEEIDYLNKMNRY